MLHVGVKPMRPGSKFTFIPWLLLCSSFTSRLGQVGSCPCYGSRWEVRVAVQYDCLVSPAKGVDATQSLCALGYVSRGASLRKSLSLSSLFIFVMHLCQNKSSVNFSFFPFVELSCLSIGLSYWDLFFNFVAVCPLLTSLEGWTMSMCVRRTGGGEAFSSCES